MHHLLFMIFPLASLKMMLMLMLMFKLNTVAVRVAYTRCQKQNTQIKHLVPQVAVVKVQYSPLNICNKGSLSKCVKEKNGKKKRPQSNS